MAKKDQRPQAQPDETDPFAPALATLLNNLPGMAYRCRHDAQRTLLFVSHGCLELTGYEANQLVGEQALPYGKLIVSEDRARVAEEIARALQEKQPYFCTYRIRTSTGDRRWVMDKGEAVFAEHGEVEALEGFISDHSERMSAFQQLEQRVADRTRKLSALYDILQVASAPGDLQTTVTRSLQRVLKAVKSEAGAIQLLDETGEVLELAAQQGLDREAAARLAYNPVEGSRLAGWVVQHNRPLLIPSMSADERATELASASRCDVYLAVPIVANEHVRGVLTVLGDDFSRYAADEEVELLSSVGEQLGVVVENARLWRQAEELMVLEERSRLARELHDSVTQSLYSVTLFAEAGINLTQSGELERAARLFPDLLDTGRQALKEMRLLVHKLRPSLLEQEGLVKAIQHRLSAVEGRAGIRHQLIVEGWHEEDPEAEEAFYYIIQEALNNAIKHANADAVRVALQKEASGARSLVVNDNGVGFDLQEALAGSGLGLISMRERAEKLGGEISVRSAPDQGTEIVVRLPDLRLEEAHE